MKGRLFCFYLMLCRESFIPAFRFAFHLIEYGGSKKKKKRPFSPPSTCLYHRLAASVRDTLQNHCKSTNLKILQNFLSKTVFPLKDD